MKVIAIFLVLLGLGRATPVPGDAPACDPANCKLPDCLCSSTDPPGGGDGQKNPQIVMLTFDDAITSSNFVNYMDIFTDRQNPNGCPIYTTYFVTHAYNEYDKTNRLWALGHEISLNSVTHQVGPEYWGNLSYTDYKQEMADMATILNTYGKIPLTDMTGFRVPFLQTGGNTYFKALQDENLVYDCSMPTLQFMDPPLFPYTLDYRSTQDCQIPPCPTDSFPGRWVVPMVDYKDYLGVQCAMVDACHTLNTSDSVYELLVNNFLRHYNGNRAPFGVYLHEKWIEEDKFPFNRDGYIQFLDYLADLTDVYIVSVSDAIAWMKNPTNLDNIDTFAPWQCKNRPSDLCPTSFKQSYYNTPVNPGHEVVLHSCIPCPDYYPWIGKTGA